MRSGRQKRSIKTLGVQQRILGVEAASGQFVLPDLHYPGQRHSTSCSVPGFHSMLCRICLHGVSRSLNRGLVGLPLEASQLQILGQAVQAAAQVPPRRK